MIRGRNLCLINTLCFGGDIDANDIEQWTLFVAPAHPNLTTLILQPHPTTSIIVQSVISNWKCTTLQCIGVSHTPPSFTYHKSDTSITSSTLTAIIGIISGDKRTKDTTAVWMKPQMKELASTSPTTTSSSPSSFFPFNIVGWPLQSLCPLSWLFGYPPQYEPSQKVDITQLSPYVQLPELISSMPQCHVIWHPHLWKQIAFRSPVL
jgi:hypothetical protein